MIWIWVIPPWQLRRNMKHWEKRLTWNIRQVREWWNIWNDDGNEHLTKSQVIHEHLAKVSETPSKKQHILILHSSRGFKSMASSFALQSYLLLYDFLGGMFSISPLRPSKTSWAISPPTWTTLPSLNSKPAAKSNTENIVGSHVPSFCKTDYLTAISNTVLVIFQKLKRRGTAIMLLVVVPPFPTNLVHLLQCCLPTWPRSLVKRLWRTWQAKCLCKLGSPSVVIASQLQKKTLDNKYKLQSFNKTMTHITRNKKNMLEDSKGLLSMMEHPGGANVAKMTGELCTLGPLTPLPEATKAPAPGIAGTTASPPPLSFGTLATSFGTADSIPSALLFGATATSLGTLGTAEASVSWALLFGATTTSLGTLGTGDATSSSALLFEATATPLGTFGTAEASVSLALLFGAIATSLETLGAADSTGSSALFGATSTSLGTAGPTGGTTEATGNVLEEDDVDTSPVSHNSSSTLSSPAWKDSFLATAGCCGSPFLLPFPRPLPFPFPFLARPPLNLALARASLACFLLSFALVSKLDVMSQKGKTIYQCSTIRQT